MAPRVSMETLAKAAYWYYVQDLSQKEVARRLGTSQSNVSRLMRSARELGVVTVDISYPIHRELDLEDELRSAFDEFGVRDVVVSQAFSDTHAPGDSQAAVMSIARSGAEWIRERVRVATRSLQAMRLHRVAGWIRSAQVRGCARMR
mgnify:CR=1 FL=1